MKVIVFILIAVIAYQWLGTNSAAADLNQQHGSEVILYATDWCGYCKKTRTILNQQGISFKEFNIEKSTQAQSEFKQLGGRGVPLLLIQGEVIKGFNQARIQELINNI